MGSLDDPRLQVAMFCSKLVGYTYKLATTNNQILLISATNLGLSIGKRFTTSLTPQRITELLAQNELHLAAKDNRLPPNVESIECNQLASNSPIEDRLRVATVDLPGSDEPTLILGVFDGHGGGTTADLVCRRLFNYIALSLHPQPDKFKISDQEEPLKDFLINLHLAPEPRDDSRLQAIERDMLCAYKSELLPSQAESSSETQQFITASLKKSFQRCDDDLSNEIQEKLARPSSLTSHALRHYLEAAVSGCCAIVMVIHQGFAYLASAGDCRAILGIHDKPDPAIANKQSAGQIEHPSTDSFRAVELNDEHNCDNINEIRRLAASHPKSEQNTMIKHNRLLGHLMPFRAFGDFTYKWPADVIRSLGITRAFGSGIIPSSYETPPYLITEPDVRVIQINESDLSSVGENGNSINQNKYLVMATDGLWELFESSRDVVEAIVEHSLNANVEGNEEDYDTNRATYILRSALSNGPNPDISMDPEKLRRLHHLRLESTLTLPKSVVRNFRDDISIILLKLR